MKKSYQYILLLLLLTCIYYLYSPHVDERELDCERQCQAQGVDYFYIPEREPRARASRSSISIILGNPEQCICLTAEYIESQKEKLRDMRASFSCLKKMERKYKNGDYPTEEFFTCIENEK
jgi:hypothetical protein